MIGIDLGLNVGSVTLINSEGELVNQVVVKTDKKEKQEKDEWGRISRKARNFIDEAFKMSYQTEAGELTIEEPVYSWGRRNPKVFAKSVILFTLTKQGLVGDLNVRSVNNTTVKRIAGGGNYKKPQMVKAFIGRLALQGEKDVIEEFKKKPKYAQETLADSYFIALAGLKQMEEKRGKRK